MSPRCVQPALTGDPTRPLAQMTGMPGKHERGTTAEHQPGRQTGEDLAMKAERRQDSRRHGGRPGSMAVAASHAAARRAEDNRQARWRGQVCRQEGPGTSRLHDDGRVETGREDCWWSGCRWRASVNAVGGSETGAEPGRNNAGGWRATADEGADGPVGTASRGRG